MRIAVLSDTHLTGNASLDELGPACRRFLEGADLIIHAGDVMGPAHLDWCEQFAPVRCARGNNDAFDDPRMTPVVHFEVEGWRIGVVHDVEGIPPGIRTVADLKQRIYRSADLDILIAGDSHYERLEYKDATLLMDSASPNLPHLKSTRLGAMGLLEITPERVHAEIVHLGDTPGAPNPCTPAHIAFDRSGILSASIAGRPVEPLDGRVRWRPAGPPPLPV